MATLAKEQREQHIIAMLICVYALGQICAFSFEQFATTCDGKASFSVESVRQDFLVSYLLSEVR